MALLAGLVMAGLPDRAALTLATEASASIAASSNAPNIALNRRIRCLTSATCPHPQENTSDSIKLENRRTCTPQVRFWLSVEEDRC